MLTSMCKLEKTKKKAKKKKKKKKKQQQPNKQNQPPPQKKKKKKKKLHDLYQRLYFHYGTQIHTHTHTHNVSLAHISLCYADFSTRVWAGTRFVSTVFVCDILTVTRD